MRAVEGATFEVVERSAMDALGGYRRDQVRRSLSLRTINERERILTSLLTWSGVTHTELTAEIVEGWMDACHIGARSRNSYLSALRSFFHWAIHAGAAHHNPVEWMLPSRTGRRVPRPMHDDDLRYAIDVAPPRMKAWLCLAAFQGLRCKEIALLRREDVLDRQRRPVLRLAETKGGHEAVLPLNAEALHALRAAGLPRQGHVFLSSRGRPFAPRTVSKYISAHLHELGIAATGHQARHWFGTAVWAETHDLRVTQEMMRHSSPASTAGYAAYDEPAARAAVEGLHLRLVAELSEPG
ncbi:MAG: tyrosine-type recombinase/integrase [Acidimicrobiia bacterium]